MTAVTMMTMTAITMISITPATPPPATNTQFRNFNRRNILLIAETGTLHLGAVAARRRLAERHDLLLDAAGELDDQRALDSIPTRGSSGKHNRVVGLVVASGVLAPGPQPRGVLLGLSEDADGVGVLSEGR